MRNSSYGSFLLDLIRNSSCTKPGKLLLVYYGKNVSRFFKKKPFTKTIITKTYVHTGWIANTCNWYLLDTCSHSVGKVHRARVTGPDTLIHSNSCVAYIDTSYCYCTWDSDFVDRQKNTRDRTEQREQARVGRCQPLKSTMVMRSRCPS